MTIITVAPSGAVFGHAPGGMPPSKHMVALILPTILQQPGTPSILDDLPLHDMGWNESISLRREDMYDDDER